MREIPEELIFQGIKDMYDRQQNFGSWVNGVPESFERIREMQGWEADGIWVLTVETWLKERALGLVVRMAAELTELRTKQTDALDTVLACLQAAGGSEDLDTLEKQVCAAGTKPSHFVKQQVGQLTECKDMLRELFAHEINEYGRWTAGMFSRVKALIS